MSMEMEMRGSNWAKRSEKSAAILERPSFKVSILEIHSEWDTIGNIFRMAISAYSSMSYT